MDQPANFGVIAEPVEEEGHGFPLHLRLACFYQSSTLFEVCEGRDLILEPEIDYQ